MAKRRKKRSTSAPRSTRKVKRIRRRRGKRRGMLSEFMTAGQFQESGRATIAGAMGGFASTLVDVAAPGWSSTGQALAKLGVGFLFGALKMPYMGAGIAGAGGYQFGQSAFGLSEGGANYADPIESLPMFLNENGEPEMLSDASEMLAENDLLAEIVDYEDEEGSIYENIGMPEKLMYAN